VAQERVGSVDEYLRARPRAAKGVLKRVRAAIRKAVPRAEEGISYGMPTYKLNGRVFLYFAGWKTHYSIYPSNVRLVRAFRRELEPYEVNDKGTIRFPLTEPIPHELIAGIARFRAKEVGAPRSG
jgi:uncharacterized protein YdhG (YjbR/CyaY superfamily)